MEKIQTSSSIEVSPEIMEAGIRLVQQWIEENRDWIEQGGEGDVRQLVTDLLSLPKARSQSARLGTAPNGGASQPTARQALSL